RYHCLSALVPCLTFAFCILPRRPRPPLFPYTTLFRSKAGTTSRSGPRRARRAAPSDPVACVGIAGATTRLTALEQLFAGLAPDTDRKSTRLNSSHQIISYAVFCLKKKKQTHK